MNQSNRPVARYAAIALTALGLVSVDAMAQITDAPSNIRLGGPNADTFMGRKPVDLRPPSPDPRDLNGIYVPDLVRRSAGLGASASATPPPEPQPTAIATMSCQPDAALATHDYVEQVIQTPGRVTFVMENNHLVRRVYINGTFPQPLEPTYGGYSVGHWEGDTLVIETRGWKTIIETRGLSTTVPGNSPPMKHVTRVIEHVRKIEDGMVLEDVATIEGEDLDGNPLTIPARIRLSWRPDLHLQEFICEDGTRLFFDK